MEGLRGSFAEGSRKYLPTCTYPPHPPFPLKSAKLKRSKWDYFHRAACRFKLAYLFKECQLKVWTSEVVPLWLFQIGGLVREFGR